MAYVKPDRIVMKTDPQFNERWVQERIAEDPSILGLGDLVLKDKERIQPQAGRQNQQNSQKPSHQMNSSPPPPFL